MIFLRNKMAFVATFFGVLFFLFFYNEALAANHAWPNSSNQTLTAFINSATVVAGDTIEIASGTYSAGTGATSLGDLDEGIRGKIALKITKSTITLQPHSGAVGDVILTGNDQYRVIDSTAGILTLNNLVIQNGYVEFSAAPAAVTSGLAGGVSAWQITVNSCVFRDNTLVYVTGSASNKLSNSSAAIATLPTTAAVKSDIINDSYFTGNVANVGYNSFGVSAVYANGVNLANRNMLQISNCVIEANFVKNTKKTSGTAIVSAIPFISSSLSQYSKMNHCTFLNNAQIYPDIENSDATPTLVSGIPVINDSYFEGNVGQVSAYTAAPQPNYALSKNNIFYKNSNYEMGGIYYAVSPVENIYVGYNTRTFNPNGTYGSIVGSAFAINMTATQVAKNLVIEHNEQLTTRLSGQGIFQNSISRYNTGYGGISIPPATTNGTWTRVVDSCYVYGNTGLDSAGINLDLKVPAGASPTFYTTIKNSTIANNTTTGAMLDHNASGFGAGISVNTLGNRNNYLTIQNNTIAYNDVKRLGNNAVNAGGIFIRKDNVQTHEVKISHNTIAGNSAPGAGGLYIINSSGALNPPSFKIYNNIIVGNKSNLVGTITDMNDLAATTFPGIRTDSLVDNPGSVDMNSVFGSQTPVLAANGTTSMAGISTTFSSGATLALPGFVSMLPMSPQGITFPYEAIPTLMIADGGSANDTASVTSDFLSQDQRSLPRTPVSGMFDFGALSIQAADNPPNPGIPSTPAPTLPPGVSPDPMPSISNPPGPIVNNLFMIHNYLSPTNKDSVYRAQLLLETADVQASTGYADVVILLDVTSSMDSTRMSAARASLNALMDAFYQKSGADYINSGAQKINVAIVSYGAGGKSNFTPNPYIAVDPLINTIWPSTVPNLARAGIVNIPGQSPSVPLAGEYEVPSYFVNFNAYETGGNPSIPRGSIGHSIERLQPAWVYNAAYLGDSDGTIADIDTPQAALVYARMLLKQAADEVVGLGSDPHTQYVIMLNDGGAQMSFNTTATPQVVLSTNALSGNVNDILRIQGAGGNNLTIFDYSVGLSLLNYDLWGADYYLNGDDSTAPIGVADFSIVKSPPGVPTTSSVPADSRGYMLMTIAEAKNLKDSNINIYSIGLGDDFTSGSPNYAWFAKGIASKGVDTSGHPDQDVFLVSDANAAAGLKEAMKKIAGKITPARITDVNGATVRIKLEELFSLYHFPGEVLFEFNSPSHLPSNVVVSGNEIIWTIKGTFTGNEKCDLSFNIEFDYEKAEPGKWYSYSNATLHYSDVLNKQTTLDFPKAYVRHIEEDGSTQDIPSPNDLNSTENDGNALLPLGWSGSAVVYTPSVTPNRNAIQSEQLQEGSNEMTIPNTSSSSIGVAIVLATLSVTAFVLVRTKKRRG